MSGQLPVSKATHDPAYFAFTTFTRLLDLAVPVSVAKTQDNDVESFCQEMEATKVRREEQRA